MTSTPPPVLSQGFELADPTKLAGNPALQERSGTESYFSTVSGFRSLGGTRK